MQLLLSFHFCVHFKVFPQDRCPGVKLLHQIVEIISIYWQISKIFQPVFRISVWASISLNTCQSWIVSFFFRFYFIFYFYFTLLYWFCHTSTWIRHGCTRIPNPEPLFHLPPHTISLGHPSGLAPSSLYPASNIDWQFVSYMIVYIYIDFITSVVMSQIL